MSDLLLKLNGTDPFIFQNIKTALQRAEEREIRSSLGSVLEDSMSRAVHDAEVIRPRVLN